MRMHWLPVRQGHLDQPLDQAFIAHQAKACIRVTEVPDRALRPEQHQGPPKSAVCRRNTLKMGTPFRLLPSVFLGPCGPLLAWRCVRHSQDPRNKCGSSAACSVNLRRCILQPWPPCSLRPIELTSLCLGRAPCSQPRSLSLPTPTERGCSRNHEHSRHLYQSFAADSIQRTPRTGSWCLHASQRASRCVVVLPDPSARFTSHVRRSFKTNLDRFHGTRFQSRHEVHVIGRIRNGRILGIGGEELGCVSAERYLGKIIKQWKGVPIRGRSNGCPVMKAIVAAEGGHGLCTST